VERSFLNGGTYKGNVKPGLFCGSFLYFDLKQLFNDISVAKTANLYYLGNLEVKWEHHSSFLFRC
jgi:hypothetical protein